MPGVAPGAAHEQSHPAAGGQNCHPAHGGIHGADHQEHFAGFGGWVCRAGAGGANREQHDLSALRDLFAYCFLIFSDVLSALDIEQEAGEQGWRPILCLTLTGCRPAMSWYACKAFTRILARTRSCEAWIWRLDAARWWPLSGAAARARARPCAASICSRP